MSEYKVLLIIVTNSQYVSLGLEKKLSNFGKCPLFFVHTAYVYTRIKLYSCIWINTPVYKCITTSNYIVMQHCSLSTTIQREGQINWIFYKFFKKKQNIDNKK